MSSANELNKLLDIGIALTGEKDYNKLLEKILSETMNITNCDTGVLYLLEGDFLKFMLVRNKTLNIYEHDGGKKLDVPAIPLKEENVCAYCVLKRELVNIKDVNSDKKFNFKQPIKYDTDYFIKSMLVIPLEDHENNVLGVIQLINAMDENGNIREFSEKSEKTAFSLACQASVSLANMIYIKEMELLLYSMVSVFTAAIDERTPYNANHTKNVANYADKLIDYINEKFKQGGTEIYFNEQQKEQTVMAAMLHDIGKLVIPLEIMNKSDRLGKRYSKIISRLELIKAKIKIDFLEGRLERHQWEQKDRYICESMLFIERVNKLPSIDENIKSEIERLSNTYYEEYDKKRTYYIDEEEKNCLLIPHGTLTASERKVMESHVDVTVRLLKKVHFGKKYSDVIKIAGAHHEFLNGSGYPNHLKGDEISKESRLLVILDIFESLTSDDRPYKKPMSPLKALEVLDLMVSEGKLDGNIVDMLKEYINLKIS